MKELILIVEDNPDDEELTLGVFKKYRVSNEVMVFHDGAEAVDFLLEQDRHSESEARLPELILLDLELPSLRMEVLRRIRENERTKRLPVVLLTASNEEVSSVESDWRDPYGYVSKPIEFMHLSDAVRKLGLSWMLLSNQSSPRS